MSHGPFVFAKDFSQTSIPRSHRVCMNLTKRFNSEFLLNLITYVYHVLHLIFDMSMYFSILIRANLIYKRFDCTSSVTKK